MIIYSTNKAYLTAPDLLRLHAENGEKMEFVDWLMQAHRDGKIDNDCHGNYLVN